MPGPSDIRVNPFNNATNYVNLTERHIVPSVSPFVVRLNEIPEKQDPSNMQMFYVDDTTGQTTETALTEVAATPGAGEFRPDYSTNAFDDTSWNTGLIEFSSADAGKIIEVSYTATGTLAGVKTNRYPAWWLDRGDGSDGAFNPSSNTTISGEKNYTSVFIPAGVTVTVEQAVKFKVHGSFFNGGTINADGGAENSGMETNGTGKGGNGGNGLSGRGGAGGYADNNAGNRNQGGSGGSATFCDADVIDNKMIINIVQGYLFGSGGGAGGNSYDSGTRAGRGGAGGGGVTIVAKEVCNNGTISAKGKNGGNGSANRGGGGGGAGGSIIIIADRVFGNGNTHVTGGTGGGGGTRASAGGAGEDGILIKKELGIV